MNHKFIYYPMKQQPILELVLTVALNFMIFIPMKFR